MIGGCGMDMGFHLVYELSHTLYGGHRVEFTGEGAPVGATVEQLAGRWYYWTGGYACLGKGKCPSNVHHNHRPDRDKYGPVVQHTDGYALRQRWL